MLTPMVERVFLGWERPFLTQAADWLLERKDELPRWMVMVPTSQSGRRLRQALAEGAGALLSPKYQTPGSLMKPADPMVAADWMERVAWMETLEGVTDWTDYQELFPEAPDADGEWSGGLAAEMVDLRHTLQENGLSLSTAAGILSGSVESGRWEALARLEGLMERNLRSWGALSRSRVLACGIPMPPGIKRIVLTGITEMPPLVERALLAWDGPVTVLIGAPESEAEAFSTTGRPLECWNVRTMPWPSGDQGSVRLVADTRQEAVEALQAVSGRGTPSNDVALGCPDAETGDEIVRTFTRAGWPAFHPAAKLPVSGIARWFRTWSKWLADPKLSVMMDLLTLPETGALSVGQRADTATRLSQLRNDWMVARGDDLRHRMSNATYRSEAHHASAASVLSAVESLEKWRADFINGDLTATMERLLGKITAALPDAAGEAMAMITWIAGAAPLMDRVKRSPGFWIELMLSEIPPPSPQPPAGRVLDVQGWLELFFEPGRHLVLCGMNEGKIPARNTGDPWLGDPGRKMLGLLGNTDRAARDAFLYQAMIEARRKDGRVDVICGKTGAGGESLLPSRLLLAADRADLPDRVGFLFREVEPPEAGLRWQADWKWQPRGIELPKRLSTTSLATWLACPFRFYLKFAARMQSPEPDRIEWNARDFGNVAHEVLERWGRDTEARDCGNAETIRDCLHAGLERVVAEWFGKKTPLAVRIQTETLRQRLAWLARVQAASREQGWEILEVEHQLEIQFGETTMVARIDRIDRHRESGALRVIDYKTGKVDAVDKAHRKKITARTVLPAHLAADCPAVYSGVEKGKPVDFRWTNLQLPLYAVALENRDKIIPTLCYFTVGATEDDVAIREWTDFCKEDLEAAKSCAQWITERIEARVFWPPAEKVDYDDFASLTAGRAMEEMFSPVPAVADA